MVENIEQLIETYRGRLETIYLMIDASVDDLATYRLTTKAGCYRYFITELEKVLNNKSS